MGVATTVGLTVAGMAMSAYQANKASKAAKEQADKQAQAMGFANDEARRRYEDEQKLMRPVKEKLVAEAMSDTPPGYAKQVGEIERSVAEARRKLESPYGYAGGLEASRAQALDYGEAAAKSGAYGAAEDRRRSLMFQVAGMDRSGQLGSEYQRSLGQQADFYGQQEGLYGAQAGQGWQAVTQGVGQLAGQLGTYYASKPTTAAPVYSSPEDLKPIRPITYDQKFYDYITPPAPQPRPINPYYIQP